MNDRFQEILDNLPPKRPRSRLDAYAELVNEMRRRGTTYRNIAKVLAEKCQLEVSASTVHDFVRVRLRSHKPVKRQRNAVARINRNDAARRAPPRINKAQEDDPRGDDIQRRIAAFKVRSAPAEAKPKEFQYDPDEPLHLPLKPEKRGSR